MDANQLYKLTEQVKRKLNITWDDPDTDSRIADEIIPSAASSLTFKLGIDDPAFDFSDAGLENILFLNYCFYEWNHAANDFDANYANDIAHARQFWEVKQYEEEMVDVQRRGT